MYWVLWLCLHLRIINKDGWWLKFLKSYQVECWELSCIVFRMLNFCPFQIEYSSLSMFELWPSVISTFSATVSAFCSWFQKTGMAQDMWLAGWAVGCPLWHSVQCGVSLSRALCHQHFIILAWNQTDTLHWQWILMFVAVWSFPFNHKLFLVSRDLFSVSSD